MTLAEWRKKQGISHYTLGTMLNKFMQQTGSFTAFN